MLRAEALGPEWHTAEYNRAFPFPADAQVYTKQHGRGRVLIPIQLDHVNKEFVYAPEGRERTPANTPTGILRVIARTTGLITEGDASSRNWGGIYVTRDNGASWTTGYQLRRYHAMRHMKERTVTVRRDMPAA